jgi:hypothetical protein
MRNVRYILVRAGVVLMILWLAFVGLLAHEMQRPPEEFARFMSHMPVATFFLAPFETLWVHARTGSLKVGDVAPNFRLATFDKGTEVELSSFRGKSPVVLIFGSYT